LEKTLKIFIAAVLLSFTACQNNSDVKNHSDVRLAYLLDRVYNSELNKSQQRLYIDSAYSQLATSSNDTFTRFYYKKIVEACYYIEDYDRALSLSKKTLNLAIEAMDTADMATAIYNAGDSYYAKENNDSAFYYYSQAEKLYSKLGDLGGLGETVLYKAYVYYNAGEYTLCESEAFKALKLLQNENKTAYIYTCYNLIATALDGLDNNQEALKYYNLALKELDKFTQEGYSDSTIALYRASCFNNLGGVYVKMNDHNEAIRLYNEALQTPNLKSSNPALYAKLLNNLAYAKFKSGDHKELPEMFYQSLAIRDSLKNISGIVASNKHLGEYFLYKKDTSAAVSYLKQAYEQADEIDSHYDILTSLKMLSEIDKPNRAFYQNKYIKVNDSLQFVAKKNRDYFARIEYETAKLQTEKEELIKRNSFIIGVSAVILLFVAAIFIIYYLNSRNKKLLLIQEQQKANEEIYQLMFEQQSKIEKVREEEKSRIAMELHDGILNNIYAVRLNLEFINKKADEDSIAKRKEYIKELQNVEMEIRGVSHDLSRNVVFKDKSFKDLLESMIISQKNKFNTVFEADIDNTIDWENMPNTQKVNIYRIVQEGLQNINKYANAKYARVEIMKEGKNLNIAIIDDGVGFDPDKAKGGIGIKNLKKRAASLNGQMSINSAVGVGSRIEVVFPN
jgi:signal transduction histidine kinase